MLRKLKSRCILLAADVAVLMLCFYWTLNVNHPLGSPAHLLTLLFAGIGGGLFASITSDRFLLKLYADDPDNEHVRGLR